MMNFLIFNGNSRYHRLGYYIIGASLSEPHINGTALCDGMYYIFYRVWPSYEIILYAQHVSD
jgi:hypothetical protein